VKEETSLKTQKKVETHPESTEREHWSSMGCENWREARPRMGLSETQENAFDEVLFEKRKRQEKGRRKQECKNMGDR
jgi:hypothetical protein